MKNKIGLQVALFTFLFSICSHAQLRHEMDSLHAVLIKYSNERSEGNTTNYTDIVDTQNQLSYKYLLGGKTDSALYYAQLAERFAIETNYRKGLGVAYSRQGYIYDQYAEFPKAIEIYLKSHQIFIEIKDTSNQASALGNIGRIYEELKILEKALYYYQESQKLYELIGDEMGLSSCYINVGGIYSKLGNYDDALATVFKSIEIKEKIGDRRGLSIALSNVGGYYTDLKKYDQAIIYFEKSLKIKEELGDREALAATYCNMGSFYYNQKKYVSAFDYFDRGHEISIEINAISWREYSCNLLFRTCIKLANFLDAEKYAREFLDLNKQSILNNFPIFSEKEKELFLMPLYVQFDRFNSFALKRKRENPSIAETVFNTTLTYKGLLLKSSTALRNAILKSGDDALVKNYENWLELKKQIAKNYSKGKSVTLIEEKADSIEKELVKKSTMFSDFERSQKLTWLDVRNSLNPGEAAIEFINFKHNNDTVQFIVYCALVVKADDQYPEMIELFREPKLEEILGTFQGNNLAYINSVYGKRSERKSALYDLIWKPMENSLKGIRKVYVSPCGLLHKVSFAALSNEQDVYLCDNYSIQMVASTEKVALPESFIFDDKTSATIFGGINYSTDSSQREIWNYLEGTKLESIKIASLFSKKNLVNSFFTSTFATESEFKKLAGQSNIIHIATHGFFYPDPKQVIKKLESDTGEAGDIVFRGRGFGYESFVENDNPLMRSGLVFAGANDVWSVAKSDGEDGVLTAQEVAHIDMRNTQLVVLSACETGLGDIKGSEGVYGLQRAFKMAGVKFIIMSLWQVPDKETAEFMTLFYKRLIKLKDIHLAFNQTQKAMREKYDPYYWAAFVLIE